MAARGRLLVVGALSVFCTDPTQAATNPAAGRSPGSLVSHVVASLGADATNGARVASALLQDLEDLASPAKRPSSIPQAKRSLSSIYSKPTNIFDNAAAAVSSGFDPREFANILAGFSAEENSYINVHDRSPARSVYPKKDESDAPYLLSEQALRGGIYLPSSFTYGAKPPVILVPGTGVPGGMTYGFEIGVLLAKESFADPLWLNVPKASLADAQTTSEYVSYAINYVSGITNRNVSVVGFSQGSLNVQWSLKYWPSTRTAVDDYVALSADYHGTVNARLICPAFPPLGCTPSILQQVYTSKYIQTLRADGGDSAYVPTTTVDSLTDEIVQPRAGVQDSGRINDARGVGVSNTQVPDICDGTPAGTFVTHEGMLYNALGYALLVDALTHPGPGLVSRIDRAGVCSMAVSPGLSLVDLVATESTIVVLAKNFLSYEPKVTVEPPIRPYAR